MAKFRKITALILVFVMTLSLCGIGVLADDDQTQTETPIVESTAEPAAEPTETPAAEPTETPAEDPAAEPTEEETPAAEATETPAAAPADAGEETPALTAQTISATADDGAVITVSGQLPADAYVTASPVDVALEDGTVLAAYNIKIFDGAGAEFQPEDYGSSVTVSIDTPAIEDAGEVTIYHMADETADPAEVATVSVEGTEVSFEAESFSIYVVSGSNTQPLEGAVALSTLTGLKVGDTLWVYSNLNLGGSSDGTWTSSDSDIIKISENAGANSRYAQIEAMGVGSATLTYTRGGQSDSITVTVTAESLTTVSAATAAGVNITMYNLPNNNSGDYLVNTIGGSYKVSAASTGLMSKTLGTDGWPTYSEGKSSLGTLINSEAGGAVYSGVTGLLLAGENGYLTYDSAKNFAALDTTTKAFTIYNALGTPEEKYAYGNFLPFNTIGNKLSGAADSSGNVLYLPDQTADFHFAMYLSADFAQPKDGKVAEAPMTFDFTGDDDVWVYIDGVLVLDIGGIHGSLSGSINFATGVVTAPGTTTNLKTLFTQAGKSTDTGFTDNTFADYTQHSIVMIYMERGAGASNLKLKFNLYVVPKGGLTVHKEFSIDGQSATLAPTGFDATFNVYKSSDYTTNGMNAALVTSVAYGELVNGSYTFTGLDRGSYTVVETGATMPSGLTSAGTTANGVSGTACTVTVSPEGTATVDFVNKYEKTTGTLTVTKNFSGNEGIVPSGFAITVSKDNATAYTLTLDGANITTAPDAGSTAGSSYTWTLTNVPLGTYTVSESNTDIAGYTLDTTNSTTSGDATLSAPTTSASVALSNTYTKNTGDDVPGSASFTIHKTDGTNLITSSAATFTLTQTKDANGAALSSPVSHTFSTATTGDAAGMVTITFGNENTAQLPAGTYTLAETTAPTGYTGTTTTWTVTVSSSYVLTLNTDRNVFQNVWSWLVSVFTSTDTAGANDQLVNDVLTVTNTAIPTYGVTYEYVASGADQSAGRTLPTDISTSSGSYAVSDSATYPANASVAMVSSAPTVGTTYTVIEGGVTTGSWELTGWSSNPVTMTASGVKFTGTWTFTATTYKVTYSFVSGTTDMALPTAIVPSTYGYTNVANAVNGGTYTTSAISGSYTDTVNDGVWTFQSWDHSTQTISGADISFTGTWIFTATTYKVTYSFVSDTTDKALPTAIVPSTYGYTNVANAVNGDTYTTSAISGSYTDTVNDGVWTFQSWDYSTQTISGADISFTGTWIFTANTHTLNVVYVFTDSSTHTGFTSGRYDSVNYIKGQSYSVLVPAAPVGYHWVSTSPAAQGTFGSGDVTVTMTYAPNSSGSVVIHYVATDGATIHQDAVSAGLIGTDYDVSGATYKLESVTTASGRVYDYVQDLAGSAGYTGSFADTSLTITRVYAERTYYAPGGTQIIKGLSALPDDFVVTLQLLNSSNEVLATTTLNKAAFGAIGSDGTFDTPFSFFAADGTTALKLPAGTYTVIQTACSSVSGMTMTGPSYERTSVVVPTLRSAQVTLFGSTAGTAPNVITLGEGAGASSLTVTNTYTASYNPPVSPTTYTLTVRWVDDSGKALAADVTRTLTAGSAYNVDDGTSVYLGGSSRAFDGYTFSAVADTGDKAADTMSGNRTVILVYAPTTDIPEESPPLNPDPGDGGGTVDIPDEDVPLDGTPKTGDSTPIALLWLTFCASVTGLVVLAVTGPKKKRDER